ncbi:MAG: VCBS repeat-containing protein [Candidatus Magnetobacterium sp. LHC-1]
MDGTNVQSSEFVFYRGLSPEWQIQATGDFNSDCNSDILWQNSKTGDIYGWIMDGKSIVADSSGYIITGVPPQYQIKSVADYDGDGKGDIQLYDVTTGKTYIWLMDGINITGWDEVKSKGSSSLSGPMTEHGFGAEGWNMKTSGDYNGDGMNDMLWQDGSTGDV